MQLLIEAFFQVEDSEEQKRLQELYNTVYDQARVWFQNLKVRFHNQILQHFGAMPEREADIQVEILQSNFYTRYKWMLGRVWWSSKLHLWHQTK